MIQFGKLKDVRLLIDNVFRLTSGLPVVAGLGVAELGGLAVSVAAPAVAALVRVSAVPAAS